MWNPNQLLISPVFTEHSQNNRDGFLGPLPVFDGIVEDDPNGDADTENRANSIQKHVEDYQTRVTQRHSSQTEESQRKQGHSFVGASLL